MKCLHLPYTGNNKALTPNGVNLRVLCFPVQAGLVGGGAAKVSPAIAQSIGHALTVIDKGDFPESNTGEGSFLDS